MADWAGKACLDFCSRQKQLVPSLILGLCVVTFYGSLGSPRPPFASEGQKKTCGSHNCQPWEREHPLARMRPKSSLGFYDYSHSVSSQGSFYTQANEFNDPRLEASLLKEDREARAVRLRGSAMYNCCNWAQKCPPHPQGSGMGGTLGSQWPHWTWPSPLRFSHPHRPAALC